jgi:multiple antibiotic resistance protein
VVLVVMAITFVSMRASSAVTRVLGPTGVNAVGRIMGVLVSAIAIQLVLDGVEEFFPAFTK